MTVYLLLAAGVGIWVYFAKGMAMKVGGGLPIAGALYWFINNVIRKPGVGKVGGYSSWKAKGSKGGPY